MCPEQSLSLRLNIDKTVNWWSPNFCGVIICLVDSGKSFQQNFVFIFDFNKFIRDFIILEVFIIFFVVYRGTNFWVLQGMKVFVTLGFQIYYLLFAVFWISYKSTISSKLIANSASSTRYCASIFSCWKCIFSILNVFFKSSIYRLAHSFA